jgi:hypothetical protein
MVRFNRKFAWPLGALSLIALVLVADGTFADVMNGEFDNGSSDWTPVAPPGWTVTFPAAGGNPGAYAAIQSPFSGPGGMGCIIQTFYCSQPGDEGSCTIGFDYSLAPIDAGPGTGHIVIDIDGIQSIVATGDTPWSTVTYVVPCGLHVLQLCLLVDPQNNAWRACFDNVRSVCGPVSDESTTWGEIKSLYH